MSRPYRWADDGWKHASKRKISERCLYVEQDSLADVLAGMGSGYMLFPLGMNCLPEVCLCIAALCLRITLLCVPCHLVVHNCTLMRPHATCQTCKIWGFASHDVLLWLIRLQSVRQCHAMMSMHDHLLALGTVLLALVIGGCSQA